MAEDENSSFKQFAERLQKDRLINIIIGKDNPTTYRIQRSLLEAASEYFIKAIKAKHMGNAAPDTLEFPEDGELQEAWQVLLYWIVHRALPDECKSISSPTKSLLLMQAWSLADCYLMPQLQDMLMLELLWFYDMCALSKCNLTRALRVCPMDTPLRRLLAEEVLLLLYGKFDPDIRIELSDLLATDGITGWSADLLTALRRFQETDGMEFGWADRVLDSSNNVWMEFMVAGGPQQHWLHQTRGARTKRP